MRMTTFTVAIVAALGLFTLTGCGEKTTGDKVDDAIEDAEDAADDAKKDADKALDGLKDK